jgi:hypothetical protein
VSSPSHGYSSCSSDAYLRRTAAILGRGIELTSALGDNFVKQPSSTYLIRPYSPPSSSTPTSQLCPREDAPGIFLSWHHFIYGMVATSVPTDSVASNYRLESPLYYQLTHSPNRVSVADRLPGL